MSILELPKALKSTNRKITKNFLKTHHFYMDRWGSPHDRENDTSIFFEAFYNEDIGVFPYSDEDHIITASIKYFPENFNGYTTIGKTFGKTWGRGKVAGKLVITYENTLAFEYNEDIGWTDTLVFDCKSHADFYNAIDCFNNDLITKEFTPVTF